MPKTAISNEFKLKTRTDFTEVDCVISVSVDGRELPPMGVLGNALSEAVETLSKVVKESYNVVPARLS